MRYKERQRQSNANIQHLITEIMQDILKIRIGYPKSKQDDKQVMDKEMQCSRKDQESIHSPS